MKGEREQPNGSYLVCGAERNKDLRYYSAGFIVHNFQFFRIATTLLRDTRDFSHQSESPPEFKESYVYRCQNIKFYWDLRRILLIESVETASSVRLNRSTSLSRGFAFTLACPSHKWLKILLQFANKMWQANLSFHFGRFSLNLFLETRHWYLYLCHIAFIWGKTFNRKKLQLPWEHWQKNITSTG